jgi:transposase
MSTSFLYHAFGIRHSNYTKTSYTEGKIIFFAEPNPCKIRCPVCGSRDFTLRGRKERTFRSLPIGKRESYIKYIIPRIHCKKCEALRFHKVNFAEPKRTYTRAFERYVLELSNSMTISDIAHHLGLIPRFLCQGATCPYARVQLRQTDFNIPVIDRTSTF